MEWIKDENGDLHTKDGRFSIWVVVTTNQLLDRGTQASDRKIQNFKTIEAAKQAAAKWQKNRL